MINILLKPLIFFCKFIPAKFSGMIINSLIYLKAKSLPPNDSLVFLFGIDKFLYGLEGNEAIRYGNGEHPKHRHLGYHNFFFENIDYDSSILDFGCGNGALALDIAKNSKAASIYAIDINPKNIETAKAKYFHPNIRYVCGDGLVDLPSLNFDTIVLSNVLEHIKDRVKLLNKLNEKYKPKKFLIRVPSFERDWRVPLKKEIGVDYRLDDTHFIEYLFPEFENEIFESNLRLSKVYFKWGEIWAVAIPG